MGRPTVQTSEQEQEYAALWLRSVLTRLTPAVEPQHLDQPACRRMLKVQKDLAGLMQALRDDGVPEADIAAEIRAGLVEVGYGWAAEARDDFMRGFREAGTTTKAACPA